MALPGRCGNSAGVRQRDIGLGDVVLNVQPHHVDAFLRDRDVHEVSQFGLWWAEHVQGWPVPDVSVRTGAIDAARQAAQSYGLDSYPADEKGRDRLFLLAFARYLMPTWSGTAFLLVGDELFSVAPLAGRISAIAAIARSDG